MTDLGQNVMQIYNICVPRRQTSSRRFGIIVLKNPHTDRQQTAFRLTVLIKYLTQMYNFILV